MGFTSVWWGRGLIYNIRCGFIESLGGIITLNVISYIDYVGLHF